MMILPDFKGSSPKSKKKEMKIDNHTTILDLRDNQNKSSEGKAERKDSNLYMIQEEENEVHSSHGNSFILKGGQKK